MRILMAAALVVSAVGVLLPPALPASEAGRSSGVLGRSPLQGGESLVAPGAKLQKIAAGYLFTEGPAVYRDGSLFFSDVQASQIHRLHPDGTVRRHRGNTGRGNGLYFDGQWRLVACEMQGRRLSIDDLAGTVETLVDNHQGEPFNAPNDLWIHPSGDIYFTDPDFAGGGAKSSVYHLRQESGVVTKVIDDITLPNGVIGTPDGETLYVTDYSGTATWRYAIAGDGSLGAKTRLSSVGGDGMTLDELGNIYLASSDVIIFAADGTRLEVVDIPETPSNVTFGGADGKTLYVTAQTAVYSIAMVVRGAFAPELPSTPTTSATSETPGTPEPTTTATTAVTGTAESSATPTSEPSGTPEVPGRWRNYLPELRRS